MISSKLHLIQPNRNNTIRTKSRIFLKEMSINKSLYIMCLPAVILLILFSYFPMAGIVIAFKNFQFDKGIVGSEWLNPIFYNFQFLLSSEGGLRAIRNTLVLNSMFIGSGIIFEVGIALVLNEIRSKYFKKISQSLIIFPYFVSWIVVGVFVYNLLNYEYGSLNGFLNSIGVKKVDWYSLINLWPFILLIANRWKITGYGSIVYLSALSSIDNSYYEAAQIDGATKWQQIRYISIPMIMPTVIILTLLQVGRIMNADFGMFFVLIGNNSLIYSTSDVIDTYVYRSLRTSGDIGMASATGFVQSCLSFVLVISTNWLARKYDKDAAVF